jgi:hypothetical protein
VRLEGLGKVKNPIAASGIEPATFRPVVFLLLLFLTAIGFMPGGSVTKIGRTYNSTQLNYVIACSPLPIQENINIEHRHIQCPDWDSNRRFQCLRG